MWKLLNREVDLGEPTFFKLECSDIWIRHGPVWKMQFFFLSEICMVILWQDYYGKGNSRKSYWNMAGRRFPNWECLSVHREKGLFLSEYVDDIKLAGKKQNFGPMWQDTHGRRHVYLGCTRRECQICKDIVDNYRNMFESRIYAWSMEKTTSFREIGLEYFLMVLGHAKKCVEIYCELANKTTQQLHKVATPCIDDHHFKEEEMNSVEALSKVWEQFVLKCQDLARIWRNGLEAQTQYPLTPGQNGRCTIIAQKFRSQNVQIVWIRLPKHKLPKSWPSMEEPVVPLEAKSVRSSFRRTIMGKAIRESLVWETDGKKFQIGNACSLTAWKNYSCLCMWTVSKRQERDKIWTQCGRYSWKTLTWENPHHSLIMFIWVALNENVQ